MSEIQKFDPIKAEISVFVKPLMEVAVSDDDSCNRALLAAKEVKFWSKRLEDKRKELVEPLNERVKQINAYAKQVGAPLIQTESHLKDQLKNWNDVLEKRRAKEMERIETERREREEEAALMAAFTAGPPAQAEVADLDRSVRIAEASRVSGATKAWTFDVTDPALVPREFLTVDEKKIRQAVLGGVREIAGVNIYQETRIAIRG